MGSTKRIYLRSHANRDHRGFHSTASSLNCSIDKILHICAIYLSTAHYLNHSYLGMIRKMASFKCSRVCLKRIEMFESYLIPMSV